MTTTSQAINAYAEALPEGATLSAKELLHLGKRAAVDQALSRLVKRGELMRVRRGLFAVPVKTRFGERAPSVGAVVENIAKTTGERVSISGGLGGQPPWLVNAKPGTSGFLDIRPQSTSEAGGARGRVETRPELATSGAKQPSRARLSSPCLLREVRSP